MSGLCERCKANTPAMNDSWCSDCIVEVELILAEIDADMETAPLLPNIYTLEDLQRRVAEYEDEYGLPSDALLELHGNDNTPSELPSYDRHAWLSLYREVLEKQS